MDKREILKQWVSESRNIVFFGGAGVSTESGIKDFRSVDGLYSQKFDYPPETIISHSFYVRKPEYFFRFYREKMLPLGYEPNVTHKVLAKWAVAAGITKKITYHTSRHSFATMMLTLGADLYTTSKLLGHSNVKTTQIYAKIVDSKKVEAVNLVDSVFD